jgi:hypothetical protein
MSPAASFLLLSLTHCPERCSVIFLFLSLFWLSEMMFAVTGAAGGYLT